MHIIMIISTWGYTLLNYIISNVPGLSFKDGSTRITHLATIITVYHKLPIFIFCIGFLISGCTSLTIETDYTREQGSPSYSTNSYKMPPNEIFLGSQEVYPNIVEDEFGHFVEFNRMNNEEESHLKWKFIYLLLRFVR